MKIHTAKRKLISAARLWLFAVMSVAILTPASMRAEASNSTDPLLNVQVQHELVSDAQIQGAVADVDKLAQKLIDQNAVAGMAVAVVFKDKVIFAKGYGLRDTGKPLLRNTVDENTVFQLASVSKSVSSTVVAGLIGDGKITWDSKISDLDPGFQMYEPWVTSQITIRDLLAHRSGLPDHCGDLLEDLGADRAQVLHALRFQKPDSSFRSHYAYTNFGFTEGACAAAKAYGLSWEDAAEQKLYTPLGMTSTSSRFSDFWSRPNKALQHVLVNGKWVQRFNRDPDPQSPAGGVSSSVTDMGKWLRLQLANGKYEGKQIIDEKALLETHQPCMLTQFSPLDQLPGFYGLGFNVSYDQRGRLRLGHSGGFAMGSATNITFLPTEQLGIVVLTNSSPVGVVEGVANHFVDQALLGKQSMDWIAFFGKVFADPAVIGVHKGFDYSKLPSVVTLSSSDSAYVGSYRNDFFGTLEVTKHEHGELKLVLGPKNQVADLQFVNRDNYMYETTGENAVGLSGVTFTIGPDDKATEVFIEHLNDCGEGTFKRVEPIQHP